MKTIFRGSYFCQPVSDKFSIRTQLNLINIFLFDIDFLRTMRPI